MSTRQGSIIQGDFSAGGFHDTADYLIPENGVSELTDAFLEEDGAAVERGGTVYKSNAAFGSSLRWIWDGFFDVGQRTVFANASDFGVLSSDDATPINLGSDGLSLPVPSAQLENMLFIGGGYIYGGSRKTADYTTSGSNTVLAASTTVTDASGGFTANVDAGMLMQNGSERVYVVASVDSDTSLTLREAYEGTPTGTANVTFSKLYKITAADPYEDSEHYAVCANRLVTASGNIVRFSTVPNPLTGAGRPHSFPATDYHELPDGVKVTGLAVSGLTLLIFTTGGIWTLQGLPFEIVDSNGNPQHRLSKLSSDLILWSVTGIATWKQMVIVPCVDGIYLLDGVSEPVRISHPFDEHIVESVSSGYTTGQAAVSRGHYLLPICTTAATMRDLIVCRIGRPVSVRGQTAHPWTHFDHHAGQLIAFALRVGETSRLPVLLGASAGSDARVVDCQRFFEPAAAYKSDANGEVPILDLISRGYAADGDLIWVRNVRTRYELIDAASDNPELEFSYSLGGARPGLASYDTGLLYDNGVQYVSDDDALGFVTVTCVGAESTGIDPKRCRVNKKARFFKWRIRNPKPSAACRIRSIDLRIKPAGSSRR